MLENKYVIFRSKIIKYKMTSSRLLTYQANYVLNYAMLWDIRRNQEPLKPEPIAEMDGHNGPVSYLHMDPYKIVTAGPEDS